MSTVVAMSTDQRVERFKSHARKAVDGILGMGRCLIEDKEALGHGEWLPYLARIGVSRTMAHNLTSVAGRFSNVQSSEHLPPSLDALVALTRADPERVEEGIKTGEVNPNMTIREAKNFAAPTPEPEPQREPETVDAEIVTDDEPTPGYVNTETGEITDVPPSERSGVTRWSTTIQNISATIPMEKLTQEELLELEGAVQYLRNYIKGEIVTRERNAP